MALLNNADITSDDEDPIYNRIPTPNEEPSESKVTHNINTTDFVDIHLDKNILPFLNKTQPVKNPSFFNLTFDPNIFFEPIGTILTLETVLTHQLQDPVLSTIRSWLKHNKQQNKTPLITGNKGLNYYYNIVNHS